MKPDAVLAAVLDPTNRTCVPAKVNVPVFVKLPVIDSLPDPE